LHRPRYLSASPPSVASMIGAELPADPRATQRAAGEYIVAELTVTTACSLPTLAAHFHTRQRGPFPHPTAEQFRASRGAVSATAASCHFRRIPAGPRHRPARRPRGGRNHAEAEHCDDVVRSPRSIRTVSSRVRVARYALRRTPPANVSMPPANVSMKGSPVTASSAMASELVAQDARDLVVIQGVGCHPEPSSMPYIGQVMMIFGGGLAAAASANSAEP